MGFGINPLPKTAATTAVGGSYGGGPAAATPSASSDLFTSMLPSNTTSSVPTSAKPAPERFVASSAGGVIVGKDGAPAGRVPAGSFIDLKDGKVYGADGKAIELPEGASVDFFDLPDVETMRGIDGGGAMPPGKTAVDGQWGPGGVTPIKGAGPAPADEQGPLAQKAQLAQLAASNPMGGGASSAVAGASGLGEVPNLQAALMEMIRTLTMLVQSLAVMGGGGYRPHQQHPNQPSDPRQHAIQSPPATDPVVDVAPPTTEVPSVEPPKTELPSTETTADSTSTSVPVTSTST